MKQNMPSLIMEAAGSKKEFVYQGVGMDFDESLHEFVFTEHALFEIDRRGLDIEIVKQVICKPHQLSR